MNEGAGPQHAVDLTLALSTNGVAVKLTGVLLVSGAACPTAGSLCASWRPLFALLKSTIAPPSAIYVCCMVRSKMHNWRLSAGCRLRMSRDGMQFH